MKEKPIRNFLISFIIPTYNSESFIEDCILSIVNQKYKNIEIIVVDGGSVDNTLEILDRYSKHITTLISEKDDGLYYAINKGIKISQGYLVKILSSDDLLTEESVKIVTSIIESGEIKTSEFCILSSLYRIDKNSKVLKLWKKTDKIGFFENYLHPTWYVAKKVYDKHGLYDTQYYIASDYDYYMRLLKNNIELIQSKEPLALHREGGISENYKGAKEVYKIKAFYKGKLSAYLIVAQNFIFKYLIICKRTFLKIKKSFN
tara:strand:- start:2209 stop:2988 length:780 start_codon:yes stop_codon:yes gene_type:complete